MRYLSPTDARSTSILTQAVEFGEGDQNFYYNLFALLGLFVCRSPEQEYLSQALGLLISEFEGDSKLLLHPNYGKFDLSGTTFKRHKWAWGERAFLPLLAKAVARLKESMPGAERDFLRALPEQARPESLNALTSKYLEQIGQLQLDSNLDGLAVWDKDYEGYSIYYTERVVEALCRVYSAWFPDQCSTAKRDLKAFSHAALRQAVAAPQTQVGAASISINISADVISHALKERVSQFAQDAASTAVATRISELENHIRRSSEETKAPPELKPLGPAELVPLVKLVLNQLLTQIEAGDLEPEFQKLHNAFSDLCTRILTDRLDAVLYNCFVVRKQDLDKKVPLEDFVARFAKAIGYLADAEVTAADKGKRVNYVGLISSAVEQAGPAFETTTAPKSPAATRKRASQPQEGD